MTGTTRLAPRYQGHRIRDGHPALPGNRGSVDPLFLERRASEHPGPSEMNLLVTNTRTGQAYCVMRSLRKHARKVVATIYGENRFVARLAPVAVSRFVDRIYHVPAAVDDWRRGNIRQENTATEEDYIRAIVEICDKERIDTIFPSWDPKVYLFSKNKKRFVDRGITIPVPEWDVLQKVMDKFRLMGVASEMGFPCPRSFLPRNPQEAMEFAEILGFPLIIKPRFSSGARGTYLVRDRGELAEKIQQVERTYGMPMLQEWIPGGKGQLINVAVTLDRGHQVKTVYCRRILRTVFNSFSSVSSAEISCDEPHLAAQAVQLLQRLGYHGHARFEIQVDPRDGLGKLMEINCRPGFRVWCEIEAGQDIPLLCLKIERGEPAEAVNGGNRADVFLNPIEDAMSLVVFLVNLMSQKILRTAPHEALGRVPGFRETLREYRQTYGAERRFFDWYFRALTNDPFAALAWYATHLTFIMRGPKNLFH